MRPWTIPILGAVALSLGIPATADAPRLRRGRPGSNKVSDAVATTSLTEWSGALDICGHAPATSSADRLIERIELAIRPSDPQRAILAELHVALMQAIERIN